MTKRIRTYSRGTAHIIKLLGLQIRLARKQRHFSEVEMAARIGISRDTLRAIEQGRARVEIGSIIEACVLLNLPVFHPELLNTDAIERLEDKIALLPHSIRKLKIEPLDDF